MKRPAYTVIELAMVIVVVLILAAFAVGSINNSMKSIQLSSAADKVASDLRYAKSLASSYYQWYGVRYTVGSGASAYEVAEAEIFHLPFIESPAWAAKVATPNLIPTSGTYPNDIAVSMECSTSGATIRYTTDGTTPNTSDPVYSTPVPVTGNGTTMTIMAKAWRSGWTSSNTRQEDYVITYTTTTTTTTVSTSTTSTTSTVTTTTTTATTSTTTVTSTTTPTTSTTLAGTNQYQVFTYSGSTETTVPDPAEPTQSLLVNLGSAYPGVTITAVNIAGGNTVVFSPNGTPYNAKNGTALTADGVITLSNGSATKTVRIAPETGRITIQ